MRSGYFVSPAKRSARVLDAGLGEADPAEHAADEAARLAHLVEDVERTPVDETEVTDVEGHLDLGDLVEPAVEPRGRRPLEPGLAVALLPDRIDDVVALAPARRELEHDLGRILQIRVEHDHRVAGRDVDAGGEGDLVPEVPRELDQLEARILLCRGEQQLVRAVAAAVVDDDRFGVTVESVHQFAKTGDELVDDSLFVVRGYDQ